jgi:hypothetical protein
MLQGAVLFCVVCGIVLSCITVHACPGAAVEGLVKAAESRGVAPEALTS